MAQQAGGGIGPRSLEDRPGSGLRPLGRPVEQLSERQMLEEVLHRLRQVGPLIEAAERHPLIRALLRRI